MKLPIFLAAIVLAMHMAIVAVFRLVLWVGGGLG